MPGSGVKSSNIKFLKELIPAKEWHASAKNNVVSQMNYQNPELQNLGTVIMQSNQHEISELVSKLKADQE